MSGVRDSDRQSILGYYTLHLRTLPFEAPASAWCLPELPGPESIHIDEGMIEEAWDGGNDLDALEAEFESAYQLNLKLLEAAGYEGKELEEWYVVVEISEQIERCENSILFFGREGVVNTMCSRRLRVLPFPSTGYLVEHQLAPKKTWCHSGQFGRRDLAEQRGEELVRELGGKFRVADRREMGWLNG